MGEGQFRSRHHTHRQSEIIGGGEAACPGAEVTGHELIADLCRPRPDEFKAVVTHCGNSLSEAPSSTNFSAPSIHPHVKIAETKGAARKKAAAAPRFNAGDASVLLRASATFLGLTVLRLGRADVV